MANITRGEFFADIIYDSRVNPLTRYIDSYSFDQYRKNIMIIYIIVQNRLYPELELDLIFELTVEIVVIGIVEGILKFLSVKQEVFI
jgi:hypothetical protein